MGGYPSGGDSSFFLQEIPVDVILFCFSLPLEDTRRRYEKGRCRRIACQIRTSCSDVVAGQN